MTASHSRAAGDSLAAALDLLGAGDWQRAHAIVQGLEGPVAAWLHGIVHTMEGDLDNAQYWYRRAGREFLGTGAVSREIAAARHALDAGTGPGGA